ncbi:MAG: efflux RND transporter periplasmic adaptor subunit [Planctomycetes bacterium]|nr:efflux RND transporter periplasmic adaptor subunit [Planctomycetota bacterium]
MTRNLIVLLCSVVLSIVSGGATAWWMTRDLVKPAPEISEAPKNAPLISTATQVVALGTIEPAGGVIQLGAPPGDRIHVLSIREGSTVSAQQVVAELDSLKLREAERDVAAATLAAAKAQEPSAMALGNAQLTQAEAGLLMSDSHSVDVDAQRKRLEQLRLTADAAQSEYQRVASLDDAIISAQSREKMRLAAGQAALEVKVAQQSLDRADKTLPQEHLVAEAKVKAAEADKQRQMALLQITTLEKQLALAEARLDASRVFTPEDGVILKVLMRAGEPTGASAIAWMANLDAMVVLAEVYENDIRQVQRGQKVTIAADAWLDPNTKKSREIKGTVDYVGQIVARNQVQSVNPVDRGDARVVPVRINICREDRAVAAKWIRLQVRVTIDTGSKPTESADPCAPEPAPHR